MGMRKWPFNQIVCAFFGCALLVSGCGGGGGGGGGGGSDDASSQSGVRVLHAAIDGSPMDVISSAASDKIVDRAVFAGTKGYRELPGGAQAISLTRTSTPSRVVGSFDVVGGGDKAYSIFLYGSNQETGLKTKLLSDDVPDMADGAAVRVVNGALGVSVLNVSVGGASASVGFGDASEYLLVSAGGSTLNARTSGGGSLGSYSFVAESGKAYTLLVAGEVGYYVTTRQFTDR
jgi:hypothetical protein